MRLALLVCVGLIAACATPAAPRTASAPRTAAPASPASPATSVTPTTLSTGGVVEYAVPDPPDCPVPCRAGLGAMALGPDGNIWYLDATRKLAGRITPAGQIVQFKVPTPTGEITAGPDGNVWFNSSSGSGSGQPDWIVRLGLQGQVTKFAAGSNPGANVGTVPDGITAGPDGNLWFTELATSRIGRLTPAGKLTEFPLPSADAGPRGIVTGPDGNLWFTEESSRNHAAVARITTSGQVTEYLLTQAYLGLGDIAGGPDGNLWFAEQDGIGRITMTGQVIQVPLPQGTKPRGIVAGPDGNLWFTDSGHQAIARLSVAGVIREYPLPRRMGYPSGIAVGADGRIWFTESFAGRIGSIGVKVPEASVSGRVAIFADAAPQTLTVTNTGDANLAITTVRVTGADSGLFAKSADECSLRLLPPGGSCNVQLRRSTGGPDGVQSAFLEIADNGTGSPQRISLVAHLPKCTLPVVAPRTATYSTPQGGVVDMTSGRILNSPGGGFEAEGYLIHTTTTPVLYGPGPGYFDAFHGRWLPTSNASAISVDGSGYAYYGSGDLHVVDVATGIDRELLFADDWWTVLAFEPGGIYVNKTLGGIAPGLWLVNPDTGAVRTVFTDGVVDTVSGATVWLQDRNPADTLPEPPGTVVLRDEILKRDLATGATTTWFYRPGANVYVIGVVNESPVIMSDDGYRIDYWMVTAPNQAQRMDFPFAVDPRSMVTGVAGDAPGAWVGTADGVYLWTARTGGVLVSGVAATPAGKCA